MLLHVTVISLQCAAVAAFLILWYFWAKKKLLCSYMLEDDEQILFPFRYFSWILIGIVLATCLVQLHFVRTSSQFGDQLASLTKDCRDQEQNLRSLQGLDATVEGLRKDLTSLVKEVRTQHLKQIAQIAAATSPTPVSSPQADVVDGVIPSTRPPAVPRPVRDGFAIEAKTSSLPEGKNAQTTGPRKSDNGQEDEHFSMRLKRVGQVTVDVLRVRKRPSADSPVMEKLTVGEEVKVTEKRLFKDNMWFRIITPSGRAGWVDYRFVKLGGEA